jgi:dihydrofolate reductase
MAKLIYSGITSLDGYVVDADGNYDWAAPDAEVHAFVNELERSVGTYLYGRRMYEVMRYWETALEQADQRAVEEEYARIWQAADKVVYSGTLTAVDSARTRLERTFEPERVRDLKASTAADLGVGGPHLAADALRAGLVDEVWQIVAPTVVGGGTAMFPDGLRMGLELLDERRFASGFVYLRYAVRA